jgi:hypothetical protein
VRAQEHFHSLAQRGVAHTGLVQECASLLVALATGDHAALRQHLADLLALAQKGSKPDDWFTAAWLAVLSHEKEAERPKFLNLSRKAGAADEKNWSYRAILGASLYRSGDYAEAVSELMKATELEKANAESEEKDVGRYFTHAFLAMASRRS